MDVVHALGDVDPPVLVCNSILVDGRSLDFYHSVSGEILCQVHEELRMDVLKVILINLVHKESWRMKLGLRSNLG